MKIIEYRDQVKKELSRFNPGGCFVFNDSPFMMLNVGGHCLTLGEIRLSPETALCVDLKYNILRELTLSTIVTELPDAEFYPNGAFKK